MQQGSEKEVDALAFLHYYVCMGPPPASETGPQLLQASKVYQSSMNGSSCPRLPLYMLRENVQCLTPSETFHLRENVLKLQCSRLLDTEMFCSCFCFVFQRKPLLMWLFKLFIRLFTPCIIFYPYRQNVSNTMQCYCQKDLDALRGHPALIYRGCLILLMSFYCFVAPRRFIYILKRKIIML